MPPRRRKRIEGLSYRPDGRVEMTLNQMCLLLALRSAPGHRARNRLEWSEWAMRQLVRVRPSASFRNLYLTAWAMPPALVVQWKQGTGVAAAATRAGAELPERHGEIWLVKHGLWKGIEELVQRVRAQRRLSWLERMAAAARRIGYVRADLWGGPQDGTSMALTLPLPDAVTISSMRYLKLSASEGEPVFVDVKSRGVTVKPDVRAVLALLEGKRGVRYCWRGSAVSDG